MTPSNKASNLCMPMSFTPHNFPRAKASPADVRHQHLQSVPPSVATFLAMTSIPPSPKTTSRQRNRRAPQSCPCDSTPLANNVRKIPDLISEVVEKVQPDVCLAFSRPYLDVLLSPPEFVARNIVTSGPESLESVNSTPSLDYSSGTDTDSVSSIDTLPNGLETLPRLRPPCQPTMPLTLPLDIDDDAHPLALSDEDDDGDCCGATSPNLPSASLQSCPIPPVTLPSARSVFPSNWATSLWKLKSTASKAIVSSLKSARAARANPLNLPTVVSNASVSAASALSRPATTANVKVVGSRDERLDQFWKHMYADVLEMSPSLYLARRNGRCMLVPYTISIQMQTFRVRRSCNSEATLRRPPSARPSSPQLIVPALRPRETRENPDFIRIAVMEMAMRRHGKLDDRRPGRARYTLPPRKLSDKTYEIGEGGVPARWVAVSAAP